MISTIKNSYDFIFAYLEWQIVNAQGQFEDNGEYCYIQDYWIHPLFRNENKKILLELSKHIAEHPFSRKVKWVYWCREKYNDRISKICLKERFLKGDNYGWKKEQFAAGRAG